MPTYDTACAPRKLWPLLSITALLLSCSLLSPSPAPAGTGTRVAVACPPAGNAAQPGAGFVPAGPIYYVAANEPGASDSNNGRFPTAQGGQDGPWLTIQHATSLLQPGDTTLVRGGTYYESNITFANSGRPDAPIALVGYPGEEPILDGSRAKDGMPGIAILDGKGYFVLENLVIRHMPWSGIATDGRIDVAYPGLTIRNVRLDHNGWSGIDLAAPEGFLIDGVVSHDNAFYGVNISGSQSGAISAANGEIRNSLVYNHTGKEGHGLAINQGHDLVLRNNVSCHSRIHGIDVSDMPKGDPLTHDILLEGNRSYDNGVAGFAINSDSHHVTYRNNVAWGNGADWAGRGVSSGFLCYEGCWHVEWLNNTAYGNPDAGFYVQELLGYYGKADDSLLVFKNNAAWDNGKPGSQERPGLVVQGAHWEVMADHNNWGGAADTNALVVGIHLVDEQGEIFNRDEINRGAFQERNLSVDPQFIDAPNGDWRLQPASPLLDAGIDLGLPFCGAAPDIGAFERCP